MKVALLDYGAGNIHSLAKALALNGADVRITRDCSAALKTEVLVLPGVGCFASAIRVLDPARSALRSALQDGFPCIGICLGMQLLFDSSEEGDVEGIGFIAGRVRRLRGPMIPQIGWNTIEVREDAREVMGSLQWAYYANSYVCEPANAECVTASSSYGGECFAAAIKVGNTAGVQFHPEKSSRAGVELLGRILSDVVS